VIKRTTELPLVPGIILLVVRGLALWLIVPFGFVSWLLAVPWMVSHGHSPRLWISWIDYNFCVALERGPLRPLMPRPLLDWLSIERMDELKARTGPNDLL
jgi:hypothetical protein